MTFAALLLLTDTDKQCNVSDVHNTLNFCMLKLYSLSFMQYCNVFLECQSTFCFIKNNAKWLK